jgi:glycosyltransferase involved in cell wall biosynthesis
MRRYGFVVPRYWPGMAGGAETLVGELAQQLADRGDRVEILTTCARDNRTWNNEFEPGAQTSRALKITRFAVDPRNLDAWVPRQIAVSQGRVLPVEEELLWMQESVNSAQLYREIKRRHQEFDLLFFAPYLFGTTFWGSLIAPERSCLIPCLHDEYYAYTKVIASMFRQVRGALFNAAAEQHLAERLYGPVRGAEVGMGFTFDLYEGERAAYFNDGSPFILYVGRKETGKNAHLLLDYFISAKDNGLIPPALKLVIVGGGSFADLHRPHALERHDIIDVPHVSELEKQQLLRQARLLVQPSTNESFSIVLMESWLMGTPVLVNAACAVTREHVLRSGGGLYFSDLADFGGTVTALCIDEELRSSMAAAGARYVRERYSWPAVLNRFDAAVATILASAPHAHPKSAAESEGMA